MSRHTCHRPKMSSNDLTFLCKSCKHLFSRRNLYEDPDGLLHCYHCLKAFCNKGDRNSDDVDGRVMTFPEVSTRRRATSAPKRKYLSPLTIESHFKYEHKEVPIFLTRFGCETSLKFNPMELKYGETRCLLLLNVKDLEVPEEKKQRQGKVTFASSRPAVLLLASRIASPRHASPQPLPSDKFVLWIASNLPDGLRYSLAASTSDCSSGQKFCGACTALGRDAVDVLAEGAALCLLQVHVDRLTANGSSPILLEAEVREDA